MNTIKLNLHDNNQPIAIEMASPSIERQQFEWDAYGQTASLRLIFSNQTQVACLYLDDGLSKLQMKRLVEQYKRKVPAIVRLGNPIKAIHYIEAGLGWPDDEQSEPRSILNCLPDEEWAGMASRPPVVAQHPLLNQPADTLAFQSFMRCGMPVVVNYDSIAEIEQHHAFLEIKIHPRGNAELLGCALICLKDTSAATSLAESLRSRRVKRICCNQMVKIVNVLPKAHLCRGKELGGGWCWDSSAEFGQPCLWRNALLAHPDDYAIQRDNMNFAQAIRSASLVWGAIRSPLGIQTFKV